MDRKKALVSSNVKRIEGRYHEIKDWVQDPKGYFLIRSDKVNMALELGICKRDNVIEVIITGKKPQDVYFAAIEGGYISRMDHAAYLGKELEKAYLAMRFGLDYVQDEILELGSEKRG